MLTRRQRDRLVKSTPVSGEARDRHRYHSKYAWMLLRMHAARDCVRCLTAVSIPSVSHASLNVCAGDTEADDANDWCCDEAEGDDDDGSVDDAAALAARC